MAKRKYLTEFMAGAYCDHMTLVQEQNLARVDSELAKMFTPDKLPHYHVYMICALPRVTIDPKSFAVTKDIAELTFRIHRGADVEARSIRWANTWHQTDVKVEAPFPHNQLNFVSETAKASFAAPATIFAATCSPEFASALYLSVLYVGQAYGDEGSRNAQTRLQNHSTLQAINAEMSRTHPDQEVWLLLMDFVPNLMFDIDPRKPTLTTPDEDKVHALQALAASFSKAQLICFVEAALIRYFQPGFNTVFRGKSFPNPAHKTYRECYDFDFGSVCAEIAAYDALIPFQIYSEAVEPTWYHFARFPLHSPKERADLWSEMLEEGSEAK